MRISWSEVQEIIDILKILKDNNVDLQYILENRHVKLKDISGIETLISENKWEPELSIGRATFKILESAKYLKVTKSRGDGYKVTEEQIEELINLGLLNEEDLQYKGEEPYRRTNTTVKQNFAIDKLITVLKALQKHNFDLENLPRTSKKLGEIKGLEHIIREENLDPSYNIGQVIEDVARQIKKSEKGEDFKKIYTIPPDRIEVLKGFDILFPKEKNNNQSQNSPEEAGEDESLEEVAHDTTNNTGERLEEIIKPSEEFIEMPEEIVETSEEIIEISEKSIEPLEEIAETSSLQSVTEEQLDVSEDKKALLTRITEKRKNRPHRETATDKLMNLLDMLETYSPGISLRLPKANTKLGDIEELSEIIELLGLSKDQKINIGATVSKAKAQAIGLYVDRVISVTNIETLKKYGLLTDEEIEEFRKREKSKVNGKVKSNSEILVGVLQILINNGIDILDLPRSSIKIGEIDYLKPIVDKEKLDENYDIGLNLGNIILAIKEELSGKSSRYAISDEIIKKMRDWGFVSDWELQKYQKQITAVQELIIMCKILKRRGINLKDLLPYDIEIGKINNVEGLEQIIQEEHIPEKYKMGKVMRSVLYTAKTRILESENPEYKKIRNSELLKINDEEIDELIELGILTEESMETFRKVQAKKLNNLLTEKVITQYKSDDRSQTIEQIMRAAVAQYVANNEETRRELAELLLSKDDINKE